MVFGHKLIEKQSVAIVPLADDPARKHMSKADVIKLKDIEAKKKAEIAEFQRSLDAKYKKEEPKVAPVANEADEEISKLRKEQGSIKGPGSKEKRAKIQERINELEKAKLAVPA